MGLRYSVEEIDELIRRVKAMFMGIRGVEASSYYQEILGEGKAEGLLEGRLEGRVEGRVEGQVEEVRKVIDRLGRIRFGEPSPAHAAMIEAISDLGQGEALIDRLLSAESWSDLLSKS